MSNIDRHPRCHIRTSLGNCDPLGGFCTSVSEPICEALHKASRSQEWTLCTDRMPNENDAYIVTCVGEGTKWTDVAEYSKRHKGWRYGLRSDDIIAWMPLPEPWKGES